MIKLCENRTAVELTASMISKGREPHSIVICGEKGLGKRKIAQVIASQLLCERGDGTPCGVCRHCRLAESGTHPDIITLTASETGNYKVDDIRKITAEAYISPSEGRYRIYIIPDLDRSVQTLTQIQNILLKVIEEPPESAVIILTARSKEIFLDTIISRTVQLQAEEVDFSQAQGWLIDSGVDRKTAEEAVRRCGGNIGRCLEYAENEDLRRLGDIALEASAAIADSDEYGLLRALSSAEAKKDQLRDLLMFMQRIMRDSARLRCDARQTIVYSAEVCRKLSINCPLKKLIYLYDILGEYMVRAASNCSPAVLATSLSAELASDNQL